MAKNRQKLLMERDLFSDDVFSFFDEQFSIKELQDEFENGQRESGRIIDCIRDVVKGRAHSMNTDEEPKLIVVLNDEQKQALRNHTLNLDKAGEDEFYCQLRNNGKYGKKLTVKEELAEKGISPQDVELALQMDAIKDLLAEVVQSLSEIESKVTEVYQGQRNDRLGLYYSGLNLYIEAKSIQERSLQRNVEVQALKSISDSNAQLIQELRSSIEYLVLEKYKKVKNPLEIIEEHLSVIHQCYDVIYRTSFLKAKIYYENDELTAMLTAIEEYGRFVEKLIVPYAGKLSELDKHEQFIEKGTWGKIANTLSGCKNLRKQITENNVYYISFKEEENAG